MHHDFLLFWNQICCKLDWRKTRSLILRDIRLCACGCPGSFIVPRPQLSDLPTLVPALPHMVTGTQAQRATQLCPQVSCRLSIHRAVCPWVSRRLHRSHVGCPYNGMSVDPLWTPQVACIRPFPAVHAVSFTSYFPGVHPTSRQTRFPLSAQSRPHPAPFRALGP